MAEEVHLGAPAPMVIEMPDGSTVFGSRRIAGVSDDVTTRLYLTTPTAGNVAVRTSHLCALLSAIYAFDLFVNNEDRHLGNYLSIDDNGVRRMYAFDFSRAMFWNGLAGYPAPTSNTRRCGTLLKSLHGFDAPAAEAILDRLANLKMTAIEGFINRMPADWLPDADRVGLLNWWKDGQRQGRIDFVREGIKNGTLL